MSKSTLPLYPLDLVLIKGLKSKDKDVRRTSIDRFFNKDLDRLINRLKYDIFKGKMEYDDIVSDLYLYLADGGWKVLDTYGGDSRLATWVSCEVWRESAGMLNETEIKADVYKVLSIMPDVQYAEVLRLNLVEKYDPESTAALMGITVADFYKIKTCAIRQFISVYGENMKYDLN